MRSASSAGPAGIRVRPPKNVTSTPRPDRSRSASSGTTAPAAQPVGEDVERRALAAGQRDDLHAERLAGTPGTARTAPSGFSRSATVVIGQPLRGDPRAGGVPVAGVRQRDHHARAGLRRAAARCSSP